MPGAADRAHILRALLVDAGVAVGADHDGPGDGSGDSDALADAVDRLSLAPTPPPAAPLAVPPPVPPVADNNTSPATPSAAVLTASAVRALAARAHGMVGADLLQVVKAQLGHHLTPLSDPYLTTYLAPI